MSWLSSIFSPRKRPVQDTDTQDAGFLGGVFKKLKAETPILPLLKGDDETVEIDPEDTICYLVEEETNIAPLVSSILVPRPLVLVAWNNKQGDLSIIPTSFCSLVSENPAYISIGLAKDALPEDTSAEAVARSKEFTVSIVSEWLAEAAARTAGTYELPEDDADLKTGLTTSASEKVAVPSISEAAASLECKLTHRHNIKDSEGEVASIVVIAEVVCIHVNKAVLVDPEDKNSIVDASKLKPVATIGTDMSASITMPYSLALAASPPASPHSPEIREAHAKLSHKAADRAEAVANAVVEALANETTTPNGDLENARDELAETVLTAVETVLEPESEEANSEVEAGEESDAVEDEEEEGIPTENSEEE